MALIGEHELQKGGIIMVEMGAYKGKLECGSDNQADKLHT